MNAWSRARRLADADARIPLALAAGVARLRVVPLCGGDRRPRDYMPWTARDALERAVARDAVWKSTSGIALVEFSKRRACIETVAYAHIEVVLKI